MVSQKRAKARISARPTARNGAIRHCRRPGLRLQWTSDSDRWFAEVGGGMPVKSIGAAKSDKRAAAVPRLADER